MPDLNELEKILNECKRKDEIRRSEGAKLRNRLLELQNADLGMALRLFVSKTSGIEALVKQMTENEAIAYDILCDLYFIGEL